MGILGAFSSRRNPAASFAHIERRPPTFWTSGRATGPFREDSAILSAWSSVGSITTDKQKYRRVITPYFRLLVDISVPSRQRAMVREKLTA
jgi:hypothetical protein